MNKQQRCRRCHRLLRPVKTGIPEIAGGMAGLAFACEGDDCTVPERVGKFALAGVATFAAAKAVEVAVQAICRCPEPTPA